MLFTRNKPYTNKTLLAKEDILELIQSNVSVVIMPYGKAWKHVSQIILISIFHGLKVMVVNLSLHLKQ